MAAFSCRRRSGTERRDAPDRRVVVAGNGVVVAHRVARVSAVHVLGYVLGGEAQQRRPVAGPVGDQRRRQVAEERVGVGRVEHQLHELRRSQADVDAVPVGVEADTDQRVLGEAVLEAADRLQDSGARAGPRAERRPGVAKHRAGLSLERVEALVVGAVQHHRPHQGGMVEGERLGGVGAVGVAVDVDLVDAEAVQDRGHVIAESCCAVGVGGTSQPLGALSRVGDVAADALLEPRALDRSRAAGAARVHHDQVVRLME